MLEGLFQPVHLLLIFGIAFLVFGPRKLPELGRGLGEGIRAVKAGLRDIHGQADGASQNSQELGDSGKI